MLLYLSKRVILALFSLAMISFVAFFVAQLPNDDIIAKTGEVMSKRPDVVGASRAKQLRESYGLGKPIYVQYWKWASGMVLRVSPGMAYAGAPEYQESLRKRIVFTIALAVFTVAITWPMGIPIGIYSAVRQHIVGDYVFTFVGFTGLAVPDFILGLVLMYLFFAYFDMSVGGLFSGDYEVAPWSFGKVVDLLKHLIIPGIVLGTSGTAGLIRVMRNNLLDELNKPYVATAQAKGMTTWKLVVKYPLRVALNPFISSLGQLLPALIGGSVIVSVVLSLPTLGPFMLDALLNKDVWLSATIFFYLGMLSVVGILISDLLLAVADPRIKLYR